MYHRILFYSTMDVKRKPHARAKKTPKKGSVEHSGGYRGSRSAHHVRKSEFGQPAGAMSAGPMSTAMSPSTDQFPLSAGSSYVDRLRQSRRGVPQRSARPAGRSSRWCAGRGCAPPCLQTSASRRGARVRATGTHLVPSLCSSVPVSLVGRRLRLLTANRETSPIRGAIKVIKPVTLWPVASKYTAPHNATSVTNRAVRLPCLSLSTAAPKDIDSISC